MPDDVPYRLVPGGVIRVADNASIPNDPDNRDWRGYDEWVAQGGVPDPVAVPEPDPAELAAEALRESARAKLAIVAELTPDEVTATWGVPPTP